MSRIARFMLAAIAAVAFAAAVAVPVAALVLPRVTGGAALTVLSGSMSPTIPAGALAFVRPVDPIDVSVGDVITFQPDPARTLYVTHRVVEVLDSDPVAFVTKGDANRGNDSEAVPASAVRGRVWFHVAEAGRYRDWIGSRVGMAALVAAMAGVYLLPAGARMLRSRRRAPDQDPDPGPPLRPEPAGPEREVLLATVAASGADRTELARLVRLLGGEVLDVNDAALTVSICGTPAELDNFEQILAVGTPVALARSGPITVGKLDQESERPGVLCPVDLATHALDWEVAAPGRHPDDCESAVGLADGGRLAEPAPGTMRTTDLSAVGATGRDARLERPDRARGADHG